MYPTEHSLTMMNEPFAIFMYLLAAHIVLKSQYFVQHRLMYVDGPTIVRRSQNFGEAADAQAGERSFLSHTFRDNSR